MSNYKWKLKSDAFSLDSMYYVVTDVVISLFIVLS